MPAEPPHSDPPEPPDDDSDAAGAGAGDDTASEPPKSPFTKEGVRFLEGEAGEGEKLAIRLESDKIGEGRIATTIAGPFLYRLHELLHALAHIAQSRRVGERGPLPSLAGAAGLSLAGLPAGSVVLHFTIGEGDVDEQLLITPRGEINSAMAQAIEYLFELLGAAPNQDDLLNRLRDFDPRIGSELSQVLDVLVTHRVASTWRQDRGESLRISHEAAATARLALNREAELATEEVIREGYLYEANAKEHTFRLEQPKGEGTLQGSYDETYTDTIRGAWGQLVRARLLITRRRLQRKKHAEPDEVELVEIIELLGEPE